MSDNARLGDVGVAIEITLQDGAVAVDLTGNTLLEMIFRKPSGARLIRTPVAVAPLTSGKLRYLTIAGDLDEVGGWNVQGHAMIPSGDFRSETGVFEVQAAL